jgi:ribosomal protein S6
MPIYESFFLISNRVNNQKFQSLAREISKAILKNEGAIVRVSDFGWRNTAYPIVKPRVGKFFLGRWFHVVWGGKTAAVKDVQDVLLNNSGVLRFLTTKVASTTKFYKPRSTFYLTPEAYQQIINKEARQGPVDFSI